MRQHSNNKSLDDSSYADRHKTARPNAGTVDYHNSLLDRHRRCESAHHPAPQRSHTHPHTHRPASSRACLRHWLPLPSSRQTGMTSCDGPDRKEKKENEKDFQYNQTTREQPPFHPSFTKQDLEEFEALPIAIRRKYFSTLERLRFAQNSGIWDNPKDADIDPPQRQRPRVQSLNVDLATKSSERPITAPSGRNHAASVDSLSLAKLPAKIREKHLTREEQVIVAKQLRQSVILDAADEAILKAGRRARSPPLHPPTLSSPPPPLSMESVSSDKQPSALGEQHDSLYDSFRWLDEDEDLDLRLALDDYHANLKETVPVPNKSQKSSSFRRRLSISKNPFGRPSISSSRPVTKDATSHSDPPVPPSAVFPPNPRRKSRALSLMSPKHAAQDSLASIDPAAAHYQDPEARLKLRVYLASPQKFDEAIEFGFPSNDARSPGLESDAQASAKGYPHAMLSPDSEFQTFLTDDKSSTYSDDVSLPDPESPKTPETPGKNEHNAQPFPIDSDDDCHPQRLPDGYAQAPAASREMTLRMTLTRPDLRACEDQIYGWQTGLQQSSGTRSQSAPHREGTPASVTHTRVATKESIDRMFADIDQELGNPRSEGGVIKRIWNRVRRG
ncbi:hypothetical protein F4779DRAFT_505580 [Xylariaceae sp. FL0662B]|nr:hypothetical protein F4779DRAFT_505580 [Xylariaceae sp. FL0662B]